MGFGLSDPVSKGICGQNPWYVRKVGEVMYDIENYYNASSVGEALRLMKEHPLARLIAGGSDVLIRIREGRLAGCELIGIRDVKEIQGIVRQPDGDIYIGAATTFSRITADPVIQKYIPVLGNAVNQVGGPQVRNIGTIGGNICNGAVSADSAPAVFSLEALLRIVDANGERLVPVEEFYEGPGKVRLAPGELVTHIVIPKSHYEGRTGHYIKYSMRNAMDIATLGCCVVVRTESAGGGNAGVNGSAVCPGGEASGEPGAKTRLSWIKDIRITFGVAAPVPFRCKKTEARLVGRAIGPELLQEISSGVREEISPRDSWRASRVFRLQIGGEIAARALGRALEDGGFKL